MGKTKKPFSWRKAILIAFGCVLAAVISVLSFVLIVTSDARLDMTKLTGAKTSDLAVYSQTGTKINRDKVLISKSVNENTKNAFIAVEDKRFYDHNGIDFRRIGGALVANIKSGKKSQGASTITQQLIKNTHLSGEKSVTRKLKEMKLALELERAADKDEILKAYLDKIYFGNGCIGIEEAAQYYFGKSAPELSIAESALLAGLAKAPSSLEPKNHLEKAKDRQRLVLKLMLGQKLISENDYESAINEKLTFVFKKEDKQLFEDYLEAAKSEACEILKISREELEASEFRIETFADDIAFESLSKSVKAKSNESVGAVIIDAETGGVKAFYSAGNFDFINGRRQPGSAIKPILVYGPALQENIVTPESFVLDEKTNFAGYKPKNANDTYSGWISVRTSLSKSKNIPAVKLFDMCGTNKAKSYAQKAGIMFSEKDDGLALALGGMTDGTTLFELAGAYTVLPTGEYKKPSFVKKIVGASGNVLYEHKTEKSKVFDEDVAYLVYDMMKDCAKTGTAKKLSDLPFEVASKTGTVGTEEGNSDCYNISVTSGDVVAVAITNSGYDKPLRVNGSTVPTEIVKDVMNRYYGKNYPQSAKKPEGVVDVDLDSRALEKNKLMRVSAGNERYGVKKLFRKSNMPKEKYFDENLNGNQEPKTNTTYYSIVNNSKQVLPIKQRQESDDLSSIIEQIFGL